LTKGLPFVQGTGVSDLNPSPLLNTLRWLAAHVRFPASRLSTEAESLLLLATAAQVDDAQTAANANRGAFHIQRRDTAKDAALRAHNMRRAHAHFKCDNSAKV
jgi:hypothetical protein